MIEGPRGTRLEERQSLRNCVGAVFRTALMDEYPQLFHDENLDNCRVILDEGEIVSHVGLTQQWASIFGCTVGVGCIGGVGTYREHRGKGYATQLFDDASSKCYSEGFDFMIISGDRGLYRRAGCRKVGHDYDATIPASHAQRLETDVSIVACTEADIPILSAIYRAEPVRLLRPPRMYEHAFQCNRFSGFWLVKNGDSVRGYIIASRGRETVRFAEYAGERSSILGAAAQLAKHYDCQSIGLHVLGVDKLTQHLLSEAGVGFQPGHASGTVHIVNFPQLMDRMRPYFTEILGESTTRQLEFTVDDEAYQIHYDGDTVAIPDRGELAHLIFGTHEEMVADRFANGGKVAEVMHQVLPIPALSYGINYV